MVANSLRWTTRDLAAMPDDGGWKRYEIIDGELFVTRAPHIHHQGAAGKFTCAWKHGQRAQDWGVPFKPLALFLPPMTQ